MDFNQYVGAPYEVRGCWELLRRVYLEQLGIDLPTFACQAEGRDRVGLAALILAESSAWSLVHPSDVRPGDGVLFRVLGADSHVGVVVGRGRFLHARPHSAATIESYGSPAWARRLRGFYRHQDALP